jgi:hypothetical protein
MMKKKKSLALRRVINTVKTSFSSSLMTLRNKLDHLSRALKKKKKILVSLLETLLFVVTDATNKLKK